MEEGTESEQIAENFTCAVCLDVLYKPIVLVCGHVSCFWCCQYSMHMRNESHCPLCRHAYHHFPAICQMLHFLLKKMYPLAYNRRKLQTLEDEKQSTLGFSPDIDSLVITEELNHLSNVGQSFNHISEDNISVYPSTKGKKLNESSTGTCKQVSVTDVLCALCKQLLFQPVVLNCGHVYCEACIAIPTEGKLKCQVCKCGHPSGFPTVCKELDRFLEEQFPSEYALRRSTIQLNQKHAQNRNPPNDTDAKVPKLLFPTGENFRQWWTIYGSKFHVAVGCDMCGMCPIIGDRYQCNDCTEKCGYDLCGDCYDTGSKLPGRFNQKHTPKHQLKLVKPIINQDIMFLVLSRQMALVSSNSSRNQSNPTNANPNFASRSLDNNNIVVGSTESPSGTIEDQTSNQAPM